MEAGLKHCLYLSAGFAVITSAAIYLLAYFLFTIHEEIGISAGAAFQLALWTFPVVFLGSTIAFLVRKSRLGKRWRHSEVEHRLSETGAVVQAVWRSQVRDAVRKMISMCPEWTTRIAFENLRPLASLLSEDLAIDLGTVNTRIYARGRGIVVNEPSAVALEESTGEIRAVGKEAKEMLGRAPAKIAVIKPLRDGVIADFRVTEKMLSYFIQKAHQRRTLVHPRVIVSIPSEITQVEKRAVTDSAYRAKAAEAHLVEQAMMAAIGAGLPVTKPVGNLVVDIGGGTTDVALISMPGIVYSRSLRVAGNHMDEAIMNYVKRKYNVLIGERMAERIKMEVGSAAPLDKPMTMEIKGRSLTEGIPKTLTVDDSEVREALDESVAAIVTAIRIALERTPPELSADISDRGLVLAGGGALLKNLDKRIGEETSLPVCIADDPLCSVVLGTAKLLEDFKLLRHFAVDWLQYDSPIEAATGVSGDAWERLPEPHLRLQVHVIFPDGRSSTYSLGPHTPRLRQEDLELLHRIWLDLTSDPEYRGLHHYHVVALALRELERELKSGNRNYLRELLQNELIDEAESQRSRSYRNKEKT